MATYTKVREMWMNPSDPGIKATSFEFGYVAWAGKRYNYKVSQKGDDREAFVTMVHLIMDYTKKRALPWPDPDVRKMIPRIKIVSSEKSQQMSLFANKVASAYLERVIVGSKAEQEVERFLKDFLPGTIWANKVHAIGGYVRDQYLSELMNDPKIEAKDLDIVVEMKGGSEKLTKYIYDVFNKKSLWEKFKGFFKRETDKSPVTHPHHMGESYPIWQITFKDDINYKNQVYKTQGAVVEFADTMTESYPDSKSRQRKIEYAPLEKDIERRDFTTNMLLKDMTTGEIKDLTGVSKEDIKKGLLRGHPKVSLDAMFSSDPLRMIRLIRFQLKYDWQIPGDVLEAVKRNAERINIVSGERIMGELKKVTEYGKLEKAVRFMESTGLLRHILPEVEELKKIEDQGKHHQEGSVYEHTLKVLENAKPGLENQMAALLHDIGKPEKISILDGEIHFYEHENAGADIARAILDRLKFEGPIREKIVRMVRYHMRPHSLVDKNVGDTALRKYLRELGDELADSVLDLAKADELGSVPNKNLIPDLMTRIETIRKAPVKIEKKTILDGKEIMDLLGIKSGPAVGHAKELLFEIQDEEASKGKDLTKEEAKLLLKEKFIKGEGK